MNETNPVVNDYGDKFWYQDGLLHRLDGPAIEWADGKEWFIEGEQLTEEEFLQTVNSDCVER